MAKVLRRSFVKCCRKAGFRVCQFSIQRTHIHLVIEASHHEALARGMQGLAISIAKGINKSCGRRGTVFLERYRATAVRNRRQMRHVLAYVLHNARRHGHRVRGVDVEYSSAAHFDGWAGPTGLPPPDPTDGVPVAPAQTNLLAKRWRWNGLIRLDEVPAA